MTVNINMLEKRRQRARPVYKQQVVKNYIIKMNRFLKIFLTQKELY